MKTTFLFPDGVADVVIDDPENDTFGQAVAGLEECRRGQDLIVKTFDGKLVSIPGALIERCVIVVEGCEDDPPLVETDTSGLAVRE